MSSETLLGFAAAYIVAVAIPGPFVAAMVARTMAQGFRVGLGMNAGAGLGDLVWACVALFGLSVLAEAAAPVMGLLRYAGAAYLIWLGIQLLRTKTEAIEALELARANGFWRNFLTGLGITLSNPKPIAFFLAVLPGWFDLTTLSLADKTLILFVIPPLLMAVLCSWAAVAVRAKQMFRDADTVRRINQLSGTIMIGAGIAIAAA